MQQYSPTSIVRICRPDGATVGAGFLVGKRQIFTCAHVVAFALGVPKESPDRPEGVLRIEFPFSKSVDIRREASVEVWQAAQADGKGDIAGLSLVTDAPEDVQPAPLKSFDPHDRRGVMVYGFPKGSERFGRWVDATQHGPLGNTFVQLQVNEGEFPVEQGYSGTPVYDYETKNVIGIVSQAFRTDRANAGAMISKDLLLQAWNNLESIKELEAQKTYKYACYISYAPILFSDDVRDTTTAFAQALREKLQTTMQMIFPDKQEIYVDDERTSDFFNSDKAQKLCQSASMLVICFPMYFGQRDCAREYTTMENLHRHRSEMLGPYRDSILHVVLRGHSLLPEEIRVRSYNLEVETLLYSDMKSSVFDKDMWKIAEHIAECCYALLDHPEVFSECDEPPLSQEQQIQQFMTRMRYRRTSLPTRS
ncbi:MAG: trypsin-like peptidase domain-containing protein [Chloroflexi bacterium]|uniref:trypsin-like serine peptidase n=1 Tax=Candidatus Flexifilum breve TaxID=3140694 RepID=UPI003135B229|nr:trypsin-like peptidase domain-containing protein [Chloroflexota bacterium]